MKLDLIQQKVFSDFSSFEKTLEKWKFFNEKIVFTNGCFDILHFGHLSYLSKASEMGTKLIIGINSDDSVKKLKGANRPINPQSARAMLLASLSMVDAVIIFTEETPLHLIQSILPNFLVKGSDYQIDQIIGASDIIANGGEVIAIDLVEGFSTTNILKKTD